MLRQKFCDAATDSLRLKLLQSEGYSTEAVELVDPDDTPKNILLRGVQSKGFRKKKTSLEDVENMMDMLHTKQTLAELLK